MTPKRLHKIQADLRALRRSQATANQVERIASRLGRRRVNRGKEPVWESQSFERLFPLAIPHHGGRDLAPGTLRSIISQLEEDVAAWEEWLSEQDDSDDDDDDDDGE